MIWGIRIFATKKMTKLFGIWEIMLIFALRVRRTHSGIRSVKCHLVSENVGNFYPITARRLTASTLCAWDEVNKNVGFLRSTKPFLG